MSRDLHHILGIALADAQLEQLLELTPPNAQHLHRFFRRSGKVQLRKGQADQVARALERAHGAATDIRARTSPLPLDDADLAALATPAGGALARVLRAILCEVHFDQVNRDLRLPCYGGDYEIRPFPLPTSPVDGHEMKVRLRAAVKTSRRSDEAVLARRIQQAFSFFMLGEALRVSALEELFGDQRGATLDEGMRLGLFIQGEGQAIRMNGLSLFSRTLRNGEVIYVCADTPPHFDTRSAPQRVYAGADSFELMEWVSDLPPIAGYCAEMGSGSGVQLIAALAQHPAITRAVGVEIDRRARSVSLFNAALNGVEARMAVVPDEEGLRQALGGHRISFAMTNPPFIAMPALIDIDPEDHTVLSRLMDIREGDRGLQGDLRTVFPPAGWGGTDGLDVTKQFVDALVPLLATDGQLVTYSQYAGDDNGPRPLHDYLQSKGAIRFTFEPVKSRQLVVKLAEGDRVVEGENRKVLSAREAATSVARLVVAALMARAKPGQVRLNIRTGSPEHLLLMKFARRLEDSYLGHGITHFYDGFAVLAKEHEQSAGQPRQSRREA